MKQVSSPGHRGLGCSHGRVRTAFIRKSQPCRIVPASVWTRTPAPSPLWGSYRRLARQSEGLRLRPRVRRRAGGGAAAAGADRLRVGPDRLRPQALARRAGAAHLRRHGEQDAQALGRPCEDRRARRVLPRPHARRRQRRGGVLPDAGAGGRPRRGSTAECVCVNDNLP